MACDAGLDHEALKRDLEKWLLLPWVGVQDAFDGRSVLHMRNCLCGSTLCKRVRFAWTEDEYRARQSAQGV